MNNVDAFRARLPSSVRFVALVDAGFYINYPSYDLTTQAESTASPTLRELELETRMAASYRGRFVEQLRTQLLGLPEVAVFSPLDTEHGVINSNAEWNASLVEGTPLPAAIGAWYRDPCGTMSKRVEVPQSGRRVPQ